MNDLFNSSKWKQPGYELKREVAEAFCVLGDSENAYVFCMHSSGFVSPTVGFWFVVSDRTSNLILRHCFPAMPSVAEIHKDIRLDRPEAMRLRDKLCELKIVAKLMPRKVIISGEAKIPRNKAMDEGACLVSIISDETDGNILSMDLLPQWRCESQQLRNLVAKLFEAYP